MKTKPVSHARPAEPREALPDDLRIAYQAHTLAQMLSRHLAEPPRWTPVAQAPYPAFLH
jgi:hypothetical protein